MLFARRDAPYTLRQFWLSIWHCICTMCCWVVTSSFEIFAVSDASCRRVSVHCYCQCCIYSEADFTVYRPDQATSCTDIMCLNQPNLSNLLLMIEPAEDPIFQPSFTTTGAGVGLWMWDCTSWENKEFCKYNRPKGRIRCAIVIKISRCVNVTATFSCRPIIWSMSFNRCEDYRRLTIVGAFIEIFGLMTYAARLLRVPERVIKWFDAAFRCERQTERES